MRRIMVRYKVKADKAAENVAYIEKVFAQLKLEQPSGLRYAAFKLGDGLSFVHMVSLETPDGSNPLGELQAFKDFTAKIKERCDEPPVAAELTEIGSYRFFGG
jgi:hypothetical protein